ncbi:MAG: fumarylacetoacetate hydrolase family protein [bacterium]
MNVERTIEAMWNSHRAGNHFPEEWRGKIGLEDAYRVQQGLLGRHVAEGSSQSGWKVGLTADAVRDLFGAKAPVFGYLLAGNAYASSHSFDFDALPPPSVESEVIMTLGQDLAGPGVTAEQARAAVKEIAPAFEIIANRGGDLRTDLSLGLVDNVMQAAYVTGEARAPAADLDYGEIRVEVEINGKLAENVLGREAMDNPLDSLAWLANAVADYGLSLKAGQQVLTGSFTKPIPVSKGDRFESKFSGLGSVSATFA